MIKWKKELKADYEDNINLANIEDDGFITPENSVKFEDK